MPRTAPHLPSGRPRIPEIDARILDATLLLLGREGFARMSLEEIAVEANVSKPTIYRRYAGKAELAAAALAALATSRDHTAPPETGNLRRDLIAQLAHFRRGVSRPHGVALVGTVLAEEHETPELIAMYREHVVAPRRRMFRSHLERALDRGELRHDTDFDLTVNLLVGAFYAQRLAGTPFAEGWESVAVDAVLRGILS